MAQAETCIRTRKDIQLMLRNLVERLQVSRQSEILCDHFLRNMRKPVCQQERRVLGECPVIEDEEKLCSFRRGVFRLDSVRLSSGEVPEVACRLR